MHDPTVPREVKQHGQLWKGIIGFQVMMNNDLLMNKEQRKCLLGEKMQFR